jgi:membrane associated rhomboid family serine protease
VNFNIPPGTQLLILANVTIFLVERLTGTPLWVWFGLWPFASPDFGIWQIATYGFLHDNFTHIFFNMFAVFMFGSQLELLFGQRWFLSYFLVCIFSAAIAQLIVTAILNDPYVTIGASGGVFGLLLAFAMYFPRQKVMLIFLPIPIPAWLFVTLYGLLELYLGVTGTQSGVAHFAHLGGMVGGYLMIHYRRRGGGGGRGGRLR